jgi:hypothetical protein
VRFRAPLSADAPYTVWAAAGGLDARLYVVNGTLALATRDAPAAIGGPTVEPGVVALAAVTCGPTGCFVFA